MPVERILLHLLNELAEATSLTDVNIAAGTAAQVLQMSAIRGMTADERRVALRDLNARIPEDEFYAIERERR